MPGYPYMDEYRIFDAQAHIASDRLPQYREGGNLRTMSSVTAAGQLVELLDEAGIQKALVGAPCIVSGGPQELLDFNHEFLNGHIAQEVKKAPSRLIGVARVNPNFGPEAVKALEHAITTLGLRALKLHPLCEFFYPHHKCLPSLFEVAQRHKIPILIHSEHHIMAEPTGFLDLAEAFPKVNIIFYHFGGPNAIVVAKRASNMYLETSTVFQAYITRAVRVLGPERVIYGSDMPFVSPIPEIVKVTTIPDRILPKDVKRMILGGNLARLLGIPWDG